VVITGGEPAIHPLYDLVHELRIRSLPIHLETCGAFPVQGEMDWITLSPKWNKLPIEETFFLADEFKVIVESPEDLSKWTNALPMKERKVPIWLHPEWSQAENSEVLGAINDWIKHQGFPYRAGFQLHKLYMVDEADKRSRPTASLSHLEKSNKIK
jgi:organic radical activating enzyme